jgi:transcriptional regulator with XRE-family HTH domain
MHTGSQPTPTRPPLRTVRKAQGLTLRQVADLSHINIGQLSRVERGQASLSIGALVRLASVLGMQPLAETLAQYVPTTEGPVKEVSPKPGP